MNMPHINLPEDLGVEYAVLPGDPARVDKVAKFLEDVEDLGMNREYRSIVGTYKGVRVLVMSTGMGGPSVAIGLEELAKVGIKAAIRIGSCGAIQPEMNLGDIVIVNGAVREEGTTKGYAPVEYPAIPDTKLLFKCIESAEKQEFTHHVGICRSHDCLYGEENVGATDFWSPKKVYAGDQETAAIFVVGGMRGIKTAAILNVVAGFKGDVENSVANYVNGAAATAAGEEHEILTALEAFVALNI